MHTPTGHTYNPRRAQQAMGINTHTMKHTGVPLRDKDFVGRRPATTATTSTTVPFYQAKTKTSNEITGKTRKYHRPISNTRHRDKNTSKRPANIIQQITPASSTLSYTQRAA